METSTHTHPSSSILKKVEIYLLYAIRQNVKILILLTGFCCFAAIPAGIMQYGIEQPSAIQPYLGIFSSSPPGGSGEWEVINAFPNLTFTDPIQMIELPNQNKFLMAGKKGKLWTFDNDENTTSKTTILNIEDHVRTAGDSGLMGIAIHPEYGQAGSPNQGYIYVFYRYTLDQSRSEAYLRLSRFTLADGATTIDPNSEYVLIQQYDRHDWHNGGGIFFGQDGFLYLTIGDEGGANDQYNSGQKIDVGLLAGLLRIDVDNDQSTSHPIRKQPQNPANPPSGWPDSYSQGYSIPNDNPWMSPDSSHLEEFYAVGLRSPHRATQDPQTGDIWIGDVGQGKREEISIAFKGANMQWPYKEGFINGPKSQPNSLIGIDTPPVYDYDRSVGTCVIGGFVYRGNKWNSLLGGKYIFGDHTVRNVWSLDYDETNGNTNVELLVNVPSGGVGSKSGISAFSTDEEGNIYVFKLYGTNTDGGIIYKMQPRNYVPEPPLWLSQTGIFTDLDNMTPMAGIVPYTVNSPLWSDRALKNRWIALPNDGTHDSASEQILFSENEEWSFPEGTVFIKHFELPLNENNPSITKKLETRFMIRAEDGSFYGLTYKWNEDGTDARLLTTGDSETYTVTLSDQSTIQQTWDFPSRSDCLTCHTANSGHVLGVKTHQLNGDLFYESTGITDNQLRVWNHLGMFNINLSENEINTYPASVPLDHPTASLENKIRSYLDANCAHCHRPNGVAANFDTRFSTPLNAQNLIEGSLVQDYGIPDAAVVKPGDITKSILHLRDNSVGTDAMPPLAKNLVDETYINTLEAWINSLGNNGNDEEIWLEAECGTVGNNWIVEYSGQASNEAYVVYNGPESYDSAPEDSESQISWTFNVNQGGNYKIFVKAHAASINDDSFWIKVNDGQWIKFNEINASNFAWDQVHDNDNGNTPVVFNLNSGINTLYLAYRENGVQIDKFYITSNGEISGQAIGEADPNCISPFATILGQVDLEACGGANLNVQLYEAGTSNQTISTNTTIDNDGNFVLNGVLPNTYDIYLKLDNSLRKLQTEPLSQGDNPISFGILTAGDVSNNNVINFEDFGLLAGSFNKTSGDDGFVPAADFNCDGVVNFSDFGLLAGNFNQTGDSP